MWDMFWCDNVMDDDRLDYIKYLILAFAVIIIFTFLLRRCDDDCAQSCRSGIGGFSFKHSRCFCNSGDEQ
jgi:hypothetical protein